jgi:hypothetical protein
LQETASGSGIVSNRWRACVREAAAAGRPHVAGEEALVFGRSGLTGRRRGSLRRGAPDVCRGEGAGTDET